MKVGLVTIGQSPRVDVVPEIMLILGKDVKVLECGALDGLTLDEIRELAPKEGDYLLVTRLRDGTQVKLSREKIVKRLQKCIDKLEKEVDVIGILCTGEFPELKSNKLLIEPSLLLLKTVEAIPVRKLGVIVPDKKQIELTRRKWGHIVEEIKVEAVSPYTSNEEDLKRAAESVKGCDLIVLDCIGYSMKAKAIVRAVTGKPILLPRTLMARIIRELAEVLEL
ncbi:AroM family protein [Thermococcus sp.]